MVLSDSYWWDAVGSLHAAVCCLLLRVRAHSEPWLWHIRWGGGMRGVGGVWEADATLRGLTLFKVVGEVVGVALEL